MTIDTSGWNQEMKEALRRAQLRNRRIGTFDEQQAERKRHNMEMRKINKEARKEGYGGGIKQATKELKSSDGRLRRKSAGLFGSINSRVWRI